MSIKTINCNKPKGYWYVATPYTTYHKGLSVAYAHACSAAAQLAKKGLLVFSPISHSHSLCAVYGTEDGIMDATDGEWWKAFDAPLLAAAQGLVVVMMPGWAESKGVAHEIDWMLANGRPVRYFTWPGLKEVEAHNGA